MLSASKEIKPKARGQIFPLHLQEVLIFESDRILQSEQIWQTKAIRE